MKGTLFALTVMTAGCASFGSLDLMNREARAVRKAQARILAALARGDTICTTHGRTGALRDSARTLNCPPARAITDAREKH